MDRGTVWMRRIVCAGAGALLLASAPHAPRAATSPPATPEWVAEQGLRHARFLLDTADTLGGFEQLGHPALDPLGTMLRWRALAWQRWAAWSLGDTTRIDFSFSGDDDLDASLRALDLLRDGPDGDVPVEDAGVALLEAARAWQRGRPDRAIAILESRSLPKELRAAGRHLLASAHLAVGDSSRAATVFEELIEEDAPVEMRADAALYLATRDAAAGRSPRAWLKEVPAASRLAPRAALMRALLVDDPGERRARLEAWRDEHPSHPLHREVQLRLAARHMGEGHWSQALDLYRDLHAQDEARLHELAGLLADSTVPDETVRLVWSPGLDPRWRLTTSAGADLHRALSRTLFDDQDDAPSPRRLFEDLVLGSDTERELGLGAPSGVDRDQERSLRAARDQARLDERLARRRWDAVRAENEDRARYRQRGRRIASTIATELSRADSTMAALQAASQAARELLNSARERALARVDRRVAHLDSLLDATHDRADRIDFLYLRGPMARREGPDSGVIPRPADLVAQERELHDALADHLDRLRRESVQRIERSFEEGLGHRLFVSLDSLRALHDRLAQRRMAATADIDSAVAGLEGRREYLAARQVLERAARVRNESEERWSDHRRRVARACVERTYQSRWMAAEAALYGRATAALEASLDAPDDDRSQALRVAARRDLTTLLERYPESPLRGDLRFRLADVRLTDAREDFQARMQGFLDTSGAGTPDALAPLLDIEPAVALYEQILAEDEDFARRDLVLFHLGMLRADAGDPRGEDDLGQLVSEFADSPLVQDAQLRRGEMAFERRDWREAISRLEQAADGPRLEARVVALYKLGWSHYAVDDFDDATVAFLDLLDLYADAETPADVGFDLAGESRDLLVRSLARAGGAAAFERHFDARGARDFEAEVLLELSSLLGEYTLQSDRRLADETFLRRYPKSPSALDVARRLVLTPATDPGPGAEERWTTASHFLADGAWAAAQTDVSLRETGEDFARETLEDIALRAHHLARVEDEPAAWRRSRERYATLLEHWPQHERAPRWQLLRGEGSHRLADYDQALAAFDAAARSDSLELARTASWQALSSLDLWYESTRSQPATDDSTAASAGVDSLAARFAERADAFAQRFTGDPRLADLQWRVAQRSRIHGWWEQATEQLEDFARDFPSDERMLLARRQSAEIFYQAEAYDRAATAFEQAHRSAQTSGDAAAVTEILPWIAHCELKWAEAVEADPERGPAAAAPLWESVAERWPEHEHAPLALYQAGQSWAAVDSVEFARADWRRLIERHADHDLAVDSYRSLVASHEEAQQWARAAQVLQSFARAHPDESDATDALLRCADLYEKAGLDDEHERALDEYLALHPEDTQTRLAVLHRRATEELEGLSGAGALARLLRPGGTAPSSLRQLLDLPPEQADLIDPVLRARVDYLRAESRRESYQALALTQPLKTSLEAKKEALESLLDAYRDCADRRVAPWAQASAFRIGEALIEMGQALVDSERPADLQGDDRAAYDEVLEEQAYAFFDRGEDVWKQLLQTPTEGDEAVATWLERTQDRLYPRLARRFLHKPSFDYPLVDASPPSHAAR